MRAAARTLIVIALAAAFGCSGSGGPPHPGAEDGDRKILRIARRTEYKSLDPAGQFDSASAEIVSNVYDTLLEYHYLERPYRLVPNLLAVMPEKAGRRRHLSVHAARGRPLRR